MKVHYFYSRKYHGGWYALTLEAIMDQDVISAGSQKTQKSFTYIEKIRTHINTDLRQFQCVAFNICFGKDNCEGSSAKSVQELYQSKAKDTWEDYILITQKQYERLRKVIFSIYEREKCMDFSLVEAEQTSVIHILDKFPL